VQETAEILRFAQDDSALRLPQLRSSFANRSGRAAGREVLTRKSTRGSLFFRHADQLLSLAGPPLPRRGSGLSELGIIAQGGVLTQGASILRVGPSRTLDAEARRLKAEAIDCRGSVVMPGFVDSHTHLVFAGSRVGDYEERRRGKSYEEIAEAG